MAAWALGIRYTSTCRGAPALFSRTLAYYIAVVSDCFVGFLRLLSVVKRCLVYPRCFVWLALLIIVLLNSVTCCFVEVGIIRNGRLSSRYTVYINVQGCSSPVFPQLHAAVIIPVSAFFVRVGGFVGVGIIRNGNLSSRYMVYMNVQGCSSPVFPQLQAAGLSRSTFCCMFATVTPN